MLNLTIAPATAGPVVSMSHFGTNYLADREARHNQGIEGDNVFGHAADMLGTNTFRYPGGAITEMFLDLADPKHFDAGKDELISATDRFTDRGETFLTPVGQFLNFVAERNGDATIVLPTITYFEDLASGNLARIAAVEAEIKAFVVNALQHPGGNTITAFQIGNEYVSWSNERHDWLISHSRDYAMLARNISVWVDEAIDDSDTGNKPDIIIQSSFFPRGPNGNNQLIRAFFDEDLGNEYSHVAPVEKAAGAVTATSIHAYPYIAWELDAYKGKEYIYGKLKMIDDWQDAFDAYAESTGQPEKEIAAYVTEWNTRSNAIKTETISGIWEATAILSQFDTLVRGGVEEMHVWPLLQGSSSNLVNGHTIEDLSFDFNGFMLGRMQDLLPSKRVMNIEVKHDLDGDATYDLLTYAYEGEQGLVFYVASIYDQEVQISLDLSSLSAFSTDYTELNAARITSSGSDHLEPSARPVLQSLSPAAVEGSVTKDGIVYLSLEPNELIELHFKGEAFQQMAVGQPSTESSLRYLQDHNTSDVTGRIALGTDGDDRIFGDSALAVYYGLDLANQVYRVYQATLDREPDVRGHHRWTSELFTGESTLQEVADGFVRAPEFRATYSDDLSDGDFVTLLYNNVLGRAPDAQGFARWTGELADGATRAEVVLGFSQSPQFINDTNAAASAYARNSATSTWSDDVFRLYQATLDREPDVQGQNRWTGELASGESTLVEVADGFVRSPQFRATYSDDLSDGDFVTLLYNNVLDRAPDAQGFARWTGELADGATRAEVVLGFSQSPQFRADTAENLKDWMRAQGTDDMILAGSGDNLVAGGQYADNFMFFSSVNGRTTVADLEPWDFISLNGFGYGTVAQARANMSQQGNNVVFSDQGVEVVFRGTTLADITDDMIFV